MKNQRLTDLIKNNDSIMSKEELRVRYATERFLMRLQKSNYKDKLILKGGFLLGTVFKINQRTTKDIDALVNDFKADEANIRRLIEEVINIDLNDEISFSLTKLTDTQRQQLYSGFRAYLVMHFEEGNTRINFQLDLGVGDSVTPIPEKREIPLMFAEGGEETINLLSYNIETMLAEKTETIYKLGRANSRMKDFYDVHLILNDNLDFNKCYSALENTWKARHHNQNLDEEFFEDFNSVIDDLEKEEHIFKKKWQSFLKTRSYISNLEFKQIVEELRCYMKEIKNINKNL